METIKSYLENMFKTLPKTEEMKKLKEELLSNMEDKYHELKGEGKTENEAIGIVISEFGNIDEIIKEFDIKLDENKDKNEKTNNYRSINIEVAKGYINQKRYFSKFVSLGVSLILLGASLLILLNQLIEDNIILKSVTGELRDSASIIPLIILVCIAVAIFIYTGSQMEKYKYIENGQFNLESSAKVYVEKEMEELKGKKTLGVIVGVILCVSSSLCLFLAPLFGDADSNYAVPVMLIFILVAVCLFINYGAVDDGNKRLLKLEDYAPQKVQDNKFIGIVASIVWPLTALVFLVWGLGFHGFRICWIVFPIVGVCFGVFASVYSSTHGAESSR